MCIGGIAIGGGVSSGFYKKLEGDRWAVNIVMSNMLFALPVALVTLSSNFFGVYYHTTSTLPLLTILQLLAIWIFSTLASMPVVRSALSLSLSLSLSL